MAIIILVNIKNTNFVTNKFIILISPFISINSGTVKPNIPDSIFNERKLIISNVISDNVQTTIFSNTELFIKIKAIITLPIILQNLMRLQIKHIDSKDL